MGVILSVLRNTYIDLKAAVGTLSELSSDYSKLAARIGAVTGAPGPNPTKSFWHSSPPFPSLTNRQSKELPSSTDILILGSGITAASIAHTLLSSCTTQKITMLEARDCTSGATGRNGGHIKCTPYHTFVELRRRMSVERAKKLLEFQMLHLKTLVALASEKQWTCAEAREVETVDLFLEEDSWEKGKKMVKEFEVHCPELAGDVKVWEARVARDKFKTGHNVLGAISYTAGALWPFRFVTACLNSLLLAYQDLFSLETNTPATEITVGPDATRPFLVHTPRGTVSAKHVIHATEAYTATLVPGFVGKIFPVRGTMSAQRPGNSFLELDGARSWSFVANKGFDYVTQRPGTRDTGADDLGAEIMIGGGIALAPPMGLGEVGLAKDNEIDFRVGSYLGGILPMVFGHENWGQDAQGGRVKNIWTGVMGFSADGFPFVGKLDPSLTTRVTRRESFKKSEKLDEAEPAEWICAGYSGDGMVYAWLCGTALALMVLGKEDADLQAAQGRPGGKMRDWFPGELRVSKTRVTRANPNELLDL